MRKSPDAFRTISEVAQDLDLPQHVLRFWETRFSQIKPMKRGGGRRYYRPDDVELLRGIRHLLYDEGYTIKGVQRILKEQGVRHVIDSFENGQPGSPSSEIAVDQSEVLAAQSESSAPAVVPPQTTAPVDSVVQPQRTVAEQETPHPLAHPVQVPQVAPAASNPLPMQNAAQSNMAQPQPVSSQPASPHPSSAHQPVVPRQQMNPLTQEAAPLAAIEEHHAPVQQTQNAAVPKIPLIEPLEAPSIDQARQYANNPTPTQPFEQTIPVNPVPPPATHALQRQPTPHALQDQLAAAQSLSPEESELGQSLPHDLTRGDPKFLHGESASISVEDGQTRLLEEEQKGGFFSRLRGRGEGTGYAKQNENRMAGDDIRRLQSTLFELLECKRLLDQARSE